MCDEPICWRNKDEEDMRLFLATPEERDRLMQEAFREMFRILRPNAQNEAADDHRPDLVRVADGM
jgi:hypothetical protein